MTRDGQPYTALEILEAAKALIETRGWTQGTYGRDESGASVPTSELADRATCFCGWGAVNAAVRHDGRSGWPSQLWAALRALDLSANGHFPDFNDAPGRTVQEVLAVFDAAIARQRAA